MDSSPNNHIRGRDGDHHRANTITYEVVRPPSHRLHARSLSRNRRRSTTATMGSTPSAQQLHNRPLDHHSSSPAGNDFRASDGSDETSLDEYAAPTLPPTAMADSRSMISRSDSYDNDDDSEEMIANTTIAKDFGSGTPQQRSRKASFSSSVRQSSMKHGVRGGSNGRQSAINRSFTSARRPTLSVSRDGVDEQAIKDDESSSDNGSMVSSDAPSEAEEDVYFPMQQQEQESGAGLVNAVIDFAVLDEFVREERAGRTSFVMHRPSVNFDDNKEAVREPSSPDSVDLEKQEAENESFVTTNKTSFSHQLPRLGQYASFTSPAAQQGSFIRKPAPSLPDRFSFFNPSMDETIHSPTLSTLLETDHGSFEDLFTENRGLWWLNCLSPTDSEMRMLSKAFRLHPLTAEDIRVHEPREKVELFPAYYFVCFRSVEHDAENKDYLEPINVYLVVFRTGILSFHFSPTPHPANVRRRIRQLRDYISVSSDWICYAVIDDITDSFAPVLHTIEQETEAIEDDVMVFHHEREETRIMLRRLGEIRKRVMGLLRLMNPKADVIKGFAKRCNANWDVAPTGEIGLYLGDIQGLSLNLYRSKS